MLPVTAGIDGVRRASVAASDATAADDAPKQMETTEAGEGYTGHISAGENEALFFFDSEFFGWSGGVVRGVHWINGD